MEKSNNLAILILAAGSSTRLGEPKQLLKLHGKSLINIAIEKVQTLGLNITVILGENSDKIKKEIKNHNVNIIKNPNHKKGIGNTIAFGISNIKEEKVLIMLCDQPLIPKEHYKSLIETSNKNQNKIICSKYQNQYAVPAIFPKQYFEELKKLNVDKGAKQLFGKYIPISVSLSDDYCLDIDTKEDFKLLLKKI